MLCPINNAKRIVSWKVPRQYKISNKIHVRLTLRQIEHNCDFVSTFIPKSIKNNTEIVRITQNKLLILQTEKINR